MPIITRRSVFSLVFLRSSGGVTAHVSDDAYTENLCQLNAFFVIVLHLIRVSIGVVLYEGYILIRGRSALGSSDGAFAAPGH